MSMDLIISDRGDVMIASNTPFPSEVTRVDFHTARRLLVLNYADGPVEQDLLNMEVHDRMMSALMKSPSVIVMEVRDNSPVAGFDVPLVQIDFSAA